MTTLVLQCIIWALIGAALVLLVLAVRSRDRVSTVRAGFYLVLLVIGALAVANVPYAGGVMMVIIVAVSTIAVVAGVMTLPELLKLYRRGFRTYAVVEALSVPALLLAIPVFLWQWWWCAAAGVIYLVARLAAHSSYRKQERVIEEERLLARLTPEQRTEYEALLAQLAEMKRKGAPASGA